MLIYCRSAAESSLARFEFSNLTTGNFLWRRSAVGLPLADHCGPASVGVGRLEGESRACIRVYLKGRELELPPPQSKLWRR